MSEENSPHIDLVAEQLVARTAPPMEEPSAVWPLVTWSLPGVAVVLAAILGVQQAHNPIDQLAHCLLWVPLAVLLVDLWSAGTSFIKRPPVQVLLLPLALGIVHVLLWMWSSYLVQFEVFYRAEPTGPLSGVFVARWDVLVLLVCITLVALASSVFMSWKTVALLGTEQLSVADVVVEEEDAEGDAEVTDDLSTDDDSIYDAQALLTNLGYDVGGINGELSVATVSAVKQFQTESGLPASGEVTGQTMNMLRSRGGAHTAPSAIQSLLLFVGHIFQSIVGRMKDWWRRRS